MCHVPNNLPVSPKHERKRRKKRRESAGCWQRQIHANTRKYTQIHANARTKIIDLMDVLPDPDLPMSNTFFFIDISRGFDYQPRVFVVCRCFGCRTAGNWNKISSRSPQHVRSPKFAKKNPHVTTPIDAVCARSAGFADCVGGAHGCHYLLWVERLRLAHGCPSPHER